VRLPESWREQRERRREEDQYAEDVRNVLVVRDLVGPALLDECLELRKRQRLWYLRSCFEVE
jgi:hypothetical protein